MVASPHSTDRRKKKPWYIACIPTAGVGVAVVMATLSILWTSSATISKAEEQIKNNKECCDTVTDNYEAMQKDMTDIKLKLKGVETDVGWIKGSTDDIKKLLQELAKRRMDKDK